MSFNATLLEVTEGTAKISLTGLLDASAVQLLQEELEKATAQPIKRLVLLLQNLECVTSAGLRALIFTKQKLGTDVDIYVVGAQEHVKHFLQMSAFCEGITVLDQYDTVEMASV